MQIEVSRRELTKVTIAAGIGGVVEYYDFFIASFAAASIWPLIFFSDLGPGAAVAFSILTFGLVYITRPIGAYVFGHVGDRVGRKRTLIYTLFAMGLGLLGIALTPDYSSIGWSAIALLVFFRLLFGIGLGGEYGGAVSWITEFASRSRWRAFWNMWATPVPIGLLFASLEPSRIWASSMGGDFISYGWRILFAIGGVLVIVGLLIRYTVSESPAFREIVERKGRRQGSSVHGAEALPEEDTSAINSLDIHDDIDIRGCRPLFNKSILGQLAFPLRQQISM